MKVLISGYNFSRNGGVGTFQLTLIQEFLARGWEVHVLATTDTGDAWDEICSMACGHDLTQKPLSLKKVFEVAAVINDLAPDLIVLNHTPLVHYALPLIRGSVRVSILHSDDPVFYAAAAFNNRYVHAWVAPSPGVKERFSAWISEERRNDILMIPHGIDENIFNTESKVKNQGNEVTFVGFLGRNKGVDLLPEIFKNVAVNIPEVIFNIVGEGPLRNELASAMETMGVGGRCRWHGKQSPEAVSDILRSTAVCIHPTRIEGFGLIIAEAMLCGAVPVVTRIKGVTDFIVEDRVSGWLTEIEDLNAFVYATTTILRDSQLRESMRCAAITRAKSLFVKKLMMDRYELLANIESEKRSAPVGVIGWLWRTVCQLPAYRLRKPNLRMDF